MKQYFLVFCTVMIMIAGGQKINAQSIEYFQQAEDSLRVIGLSIIDHAEDSKRLEANLHFRDFLHQVISQDKQMSWPFDSLRTVSVLKAPDNSFRILTWYVPLTTGNFIYYGFVQLSSPLQDETLVYPLNDNTPLLSDEASQVLDASNWYGAWYYELISNNFKGETYYALLGWKGTNPQSRQRIIEVFNLTENGPVFGGPVFVTGTTTRNRIIFEYSARVAMSLKYETHSPKPGQRPRPMIVFDRLAPVHESLRGHFQHYVPEVNIFDAFVFEEGRWEFIRDVDARTSRR
jgi:hypothetical protein